MSGMVALRIPRGLWTAAVMVTLAVLSTPGAEGRDSPKDFVHQFKGQCYFTNGTERVRLVTRYIYNREEFVRFDSDWDEYRAVTPLGRPDAEYWNSQEDIMEQTRAEVDRVCRNNYQVDAPFTWQRREAARPAHGGPPLKAARWAALSTNSARSRLAGAFGVFASRSLTAPPGYGSTTA